MVAMIMAIVGMVAVVIVGTRRAVWDFILTGCAEIGNILVGWILLGQTTKRGLVVLQRATDIVWAVHAVVAVILVQWHVDVSESDRGVTVMAVLVVVRVVRIVMTALVVPVKMSVIGMVMSSMTISMPVLSSCWLHLRKGSESECGERNDGVFRHVFHFVVSFAQRQEGRTRLARPSSRFRTVGNIRKRTTLD